MAIRTPVYRGKPEINLDGPDGNAYALLGTVTQLCRQLRYATADKDAIIKDMMSSDYEHLIQVFDKHFGHVIDLVRAEKCEDED